MKQFSTFMGKARPHIMALGIVSTLVLILLSTAISRLPNRASYQVRLLNISDWGFGREPIVIISCGIGPPRRTIAGYRTTIGIIRVYSRQ
jgi:hypothetical protein